MKYIHLYSTAKRYNKSGCDLPLLPYYSDCFCPGNREIDKNNNNNNISFFVFLVVLQLGKLKAKFLLIKGMKGLFSQGEQYFIQ